MFSRSRAASPILVDVDVAGGEGGFHGDAVAVGAGAVGGDGVRAGEGGGAEERAAEARAFLVGPVDQADGEGRAAVVVAGDGGEDFERGDDAERAVEPTAVGDGVEVAAEDEGFGRGSGKGDPVVAGGVAMRCSTGRPASLVANQSRARCQVGVKAMRWAPLASEVRAASSRRLAMT